METGSCARHPPGPKRGASRAPPPPHCLIRIHLARRQRGAPHPGMLPPSAAAHGACCSGHLLGKQQAEAVRHHVMDPPAGRRKGGRTNANAKEGGWGGGMRGSRRDGSGGPKAAAACRISQPAAGGVRPRPGGSAGRRFPAAGARCGAAWWFARISPS